MFDYVALGHLHLNQKVGEEQVWYSGSPLPLSFSESATKKMVNIVTFEGKKAAVERVEIPTFRELLVLKGNKESIRKALEQIDDKSVWIEIYLKDDNPHAATQELFEYANRLELSVLAIKIDRKENPFFANDMRVDRLDELKPTDLFLKRLEMDEIADDTLKERLITHFKVVLSEVEAQ